jgi:hydroxymethylpyrimidine kinase/phosphomethylpyrimidine kinase
MKTVLVVAGYDPSGGAGILADVKAVGALGAYAAAAITSITFQNTVGVFGAEHVTPAALRAQIEPIFEDLEVDALKTGMLPTAELIELTASEVASRPRRPLVVDPVIRSTSGYDLIDEAALRVLVDRLLPHADVVTPNAVEAERLTGMRVDSEEALERAARLIVSMGPRAALVKGGHLDLGGRAVDVLVEGDRAFHFEAPRVETRNTHGTGCTLASAIATYLALGRPLVEAVAGAKEYVTEAIARAPGIGRGHGPLNHFWKLPGAC